MIKGEKTAGRGQTGCLFMWRTGCAFFLMYVMLAPMLAAASAVASAAESFSSNSAADGGTEMYHENGSFGTNRGSGPAFGPKGGNGDKIFETRPLPKKEQPERLKIMPLYPEVRPQAPAPKPPIVLEPLE